MKYFVFSDVHSAYDEMIKALNENGFDERNDNHKIIFLGDAFDKGNKPLETYLFFKGLIEKGKMIWILGNHDTEFINVIENEKYSRDCRDTPIKIAQYYDNSITENSDISLVCKVLKNNGVLDILKNQTCDYYESDKYVFTHGYVPSDKGKYNPDWRNVPSEKWNSLTVRKANGVKMVLKKGLKIPGKTLVCGHVGAYYGHLIEQYPDLEENSKEFLAIKRKYVKNCSNYHTFYSDDVINVDANGYKNGFINIFVVEEDKENGK